MSSKTNQYSLFLSLLFKFIMFFHLIRFQKCEEKDIDYSLKLRLNNGNYLMLATKGIYLYNPYLTSKIDVKIFDSRLINNHEDSYQMNIAQFLPLYNGYVICLIQNNIYIISKSGVFLTEYAINYMQIRYSYPIIPYDNSGDEYYFFIISIEGQSFLFRKYIYNSSSNSVSFNISYSYNTYMDIYKSIACELMDYSSQKVVSCIYGVWGTSYCKVFSINDFNPIYDLGGVIYDAGGQHFNSAIMTPDRTKAAFCSQHENDLIAYLYNINTNSFYKIGSVTDSGCDCEPIDINIEYFPEREEFVYFCVGHFEIYSGRLSKNDYYEPLEIVNLINKETCGEPNIINLGYSSTSQKYFLYADSDCKQLFDIDNIEAPKTQDYPSNEPSVVICDNYYNYDKTDCYDNVPNGFYCNNTYLKTIDKCHDKCEACEEGPSTDNNNCLTCKDSKYLDLGNCVDECPYGNFRDADNIIKCKCSTNISCYYCSEESKQYNLCVSCNFDEGYYPILNDENNINNSIINCYNNISISEGYYLNLTTKYYEKCYNSCKKCNDVGDVNNNKCSECKYGYEFKNDFENDNNCYEICNNYYYYDSNNKYYCIDNCPSEFNKLIEDKKRCIDRCSNDPTYKYEIDNKCYNSCLSKYYSYDLTECYDNIPNGFYCNNTNLKTIDKCHDKCETCKEGPTNDNNNCLTCKDSKYLDLGNCVDECPYGNFRDTDNIIKCKCSTNVTCKYCSKESKQYNLCATCNNEEGYYPKLNDENNINNSIINCYNDESILDGFYLNYDTKYYEECYETCKKCSGPGDEDNNNCIECISSHNFNIDLVNSNCYEKCNNYYYLDSLNKYHCTNNCQDDYSKLIEPKKRCVDNCSKYDGYKFEYENKCYSECPSISHISDENEFLCIPKLICSPKFYDYEQKACIDSVPDGFYCNDTELKTIDKCHDNCVTCEEGPTNDNNNCLTCKDSKFYDLGNCIDSCNHGFFSENGVNKCKCTPDIKCFYCTEQSKAENLCVSCNNDEGYYQKSDEDQRNDLLINCYKEVEGYYIDYINKVFKPCHSLCKKCTELGSDEDNKCSECIDGFILKKDLNNNNCYQKCDNYYYFDISNKYHCTEDKNCPLNYKLIISEKKCIDKCINDNKYKYEYQNICYEKCPSNTIDNNFICQIEKTKEDPCKITKKKLDKSKKEISIYDINPLTKEYASNYISTNDYVTTFDNNLISIYIYKNISCLEITTGSAPQIDFGECYQKLIHHYKIQDNIIISIISINSNSNSKPVTTYTFSHPISGEVLNSSEICADEKIVIQEDIMSLMENIDDKKEEFIIFCTQQGIDVFNISDEFYNNLCYHFNSPNGRDVPLKERIAMFYPNITLCDQGCENRGVDLETLKAKCVCAFSDLMNNNLITDNLYGQYVGEIFNLISSLNIAVFQCIKDIFVKEYFVKCYGAFIFMGIFLFQTICLSKFLYDGLYDIRKFFFSLTKSFIKFTKDKNTNKIKNNIINLNFPPKKITKASKKKLLTTNNEFNSLSKKRIQTGTKSKFKKSVLNTENNSNAYFINYKLKNYKSPIKTNNIEDNKVKATEHKQSLNDKLISKNNIETSVEKKEYEINIKEYLSLSFDENDFDDVIDKEKRTFCEYFCEKFKENQIFFNTFYIKEPFRPRPLKILILLIIIEFYLVVNALFYTEEYLSEILYIEGKDSFFAFVPRRFNHFIYIYAVVGIMTYAIGFFFIEERKIKKMFLRNKEGITKLKYDISIVIKGIKKRFIALAICSIFFTIICFIYISCFNIVYPNIKVEWIKSSLFIFLVIQLINIIITFLESSIRYISIKCNNEKFFRLSLVFA